MVLTTATQGGTNTTLLTIYSMAKPANCSHTRHVAIDNRSGSTSWKLTRRRDQHTSDKVGYYSICLPRKDERWVGWPI